MIFFFLTAIWQPHSPDINHLCFTCLTRRSLGASWRGWVPKPGQMPSGVRTRNLPILITRLNPLGYSPLLCFFFFFADEVYHAGNSSLANYNFSHTALSITNFAISTENSNFYKMRFLWSNSCFLATREIRSLHITFTFFALYIMND